MASPSLRVHLETPSEGFLILHLAGEAGHRGEKILERLVRDLAARSEPRVIIDLSKITFISSVGLRTLVASQKAVQARDGQLALVGLTPAVLGALQRCKLDGQFEILPNPVSP